MESKDLNPAARFSLVPARRKGLEGDGMMPRFTPRLVGWLVGGCTAWVTLCITVWIVIIVVRGDGFGAVNMIIVGYIWLGFPFSALATGLTIAGIILLRRVIPTPVAVVASALIAWSCALLLWVLLFGPGYFVEGRLAVTSAVAAGGAVYSCIVCWPRREATVEA